jgi:hypothetical protein
LVPSTKQKASRIASNTQRSSPKQKQPAAVSRGGPFQIDHRDEEISVLGRPGSDLLFQVLRLSTIGAGEFNGRVRDGIGFRLPARTTRPAKDSSGIRNQEAVIRNDPDTDFSFPEAKQAGPFADRGAVSIT